MKLNENRSLQRVYNNRIIIVRLTHLPSITLVLLLDIYRKTWRRVCCGTVRPGTDVTAQ